MVDEKKIVQDMNIVFDNKKQRKGKKTILLERGLWVRGLTDECSTCVNEKSRGFTGEPDPTRSSCCATRILKFQPDFMEQKSRLQELVEGRGHICLFLPKYHCELNWIEMLWGVLKRRLRASNEVYTVASLITAINRILDELSQDRMLLMKFQTHVLRYCDAYRKGCNGRLAVLAVKKFTSHRHLPDSWLSEILRSTNPHSMRNHVPQFVALKPRPKQSEGKKCSLGSVPQVGSKHA